MSANDRQVGGRHYKTGAIMEHWDLIERFGIGYLEGCATKYIARWRLKERPLEDLEKALHYVEKLIEMREEHDRLPRGIVPEPQLLVFFSSLPSDATDLDRQALTKILRWEVLNDLYEARSCVRRIISRLKLSTDEDLDSRAQWLDAADREKPSHYRV